MTMEKLFAMIAAYVHKVKPFAGLALIILGTLALILTRVTSLATSNALLLTGLLFIIAGIWLHIRSIKHESRY